MTPLKDNDAGEQPGETSHDEGVRPEGERARPFRVASQHKAPSTGDEIRNVLR